MLMSKLEGVQTVPFLCNVMIDPGQCTPKRTLTSQTNHPTRGNGNESGGGVIRNGSFYRAKGGPTRSEVNIFGGLEGPSIEETEEGLQDNKGPSGSSWRPEKGSLFCDAVDSYVNDDVTEYNSSPVKLGVFPTCSVNNLFSHLSLSCPALDETETEPKQPRPVPVIIELPPPTVPRKSLRSETAPPAIMKADASKVPFVITPVDEHCPRDIPLKLAGLVLQNGSHPDKNCIDSTTLISLINGKLKNLYDKVIIFDCRFAYEFKGGHIKGALNFPQQDELVNFLINKSSYQQYGDKICLVYHCEFSSKRAPHCFQVIRDLDRKKNSTSYPNIFYPEMYILEGGYKQFYQDQPSYCEPRGYVEMKDPQYINDMKKAMRHLSRTKSKKRLQSQSCSNLFFELQRASLLNEEEECRPSSTNRALNLSAR